MARPQAAELKQQGAMEAARNGNSSVTAEDAERVIVEETKKTGNEAYQFDPNASPGEKAAQAASVSDRWRLRRVWFQAERKSVVAISMCHHRFIMNDVRKLRPSSPTW